MTFVTVTLNEKNISEQILENGMANVMKPYKSDEEFSKYLNDLVAAEEKGKKSKLGIFKSAEKALARFNDLTLPKQSSKAKNFYNFLKEEKNILGVIELVLNGSRFKVRLNQQNSQILLVLHGIRCLPNDENYKSYAKYSEEALRFSKENILQRDVEVEVSAVDNKGIFHGTIFVNKKNYSSTLVESGLAHCFAVGKSLCRYQTVYNSLEDEAKKKKLGMWNDEIKINYLNDFDQGSYVDLKNVKKNVDASEVIGPEIFYLQDKSNKGMKLIETEIAKISKQSENLGGLIKKGTPCVAQYSDDGNWYRGKINRQLKNGNFNVFFIDFGNEVPFYYKIF